MPPKHNISEEHKVFTLWTMFGQIKAYYQRLIPSMEEDDWEAMERRLTIQHLKKGEYLTRSGEICRHVSFINRGLLRMFYVVDGREICTGIVAENEYFGQYDSFLTREPSSGNIEAVEDSELINLSYDDMQFLYKSHPVFEVFGRKIAEMLFILVMSQASSLLTQTPEERYQSFLDKRPHLFQRIPQYMIASLIGITPEHLSRIRKKMAVR